MPAFQAGRCEFEPHRVLVESMWLFLGTPPFVRRVRGKTAQEMM